MLDAGVGVGLEEQFDVGDAIAIALVRAGDLLSEDEGVDTLVGIVEEGPSGDDQHPAGVPHAAADEPCGHLELVLGKLVVADQRIVVVGAEARETAHLGEAVVERVERRGVVRVVELVVADRERQQPAQPGSGRGHHFAVQLQKIDGISHEAPSTIMLPL